MKESQYKSYDDLPLFLNAEQVAAVLGVSSSSAYELMLKAGFPTLRVGSNRMVVPREKFIAWVEERTKGGDTQPVWIGRSCKICGTSASRMCAAPTERSISWTRINSRREMTDHA